MPCLMLGLALLTPGVAHACASLLRQRAPYLGSSKFFLLLPAP
jgi:hypothetical protein